MAIDPRSKGQLATEFAAAHQRAADLEKVLDISLEMTSEMNLSRLLGKIMAAACDLSHSEAASIILQDRDTGNLRFRAATGQATDALSDVGIPVDGSIAGAVFTSGEPAVISHVQSDGRYYSGVDDQIGFETHSMAAIPLKLGERCIGVLETINKAQHGVYDEQDVEMLTALASHAAVAIENARLYDDTLEMKEFNERLVESMAEGILVLDATEAISFVNRAGAEMLGYAPEEMVGQQWKSVLCEEDHVPGPDRLIAQDRRQIEQFECELISKRGRRISAHVSIAPRYQGGQYESAIVVFADITQVLANRALHQELEMAWRIQESFLPDALPAVHGWQIAAELAPAQQTSGDFYDLIRLPNGKQGILIADVAGKGIGSALLMAMSRTLMRTYAFEHMLDPELAVSSASNRILSDTHSGLFVTVFYGILDPASGAMIYCNAGHPPPYLLRATNGGSFEKLGRTGIPLGISDGMTWRQSTIELSPGDLLVLYTDGVTEAQNAQGSFFGEARLLEVLDANRESSAADIRKNLMAAIRGFVGDTVQSDDITLMVIRRDWDTSEA